MYMYIYEDPQGWRDGSSRANGGTSTMAVVSLTPSTCLDPKGIGGHSHMSRLLPQSADTCLMHSYLSFF